MTGSTQASFDFGSERDVAEKLRTALAAQPAAVALWANSPIVNGADTGLAVLPDEGVGGDRPGALGAPAVRVRARVRRGPVPARTSSGRSTCPMIFLRAGRQLPATGGRTFRAFLAEGIDGERPTLADWEDHLTTVFPEVRREGRRRGPRVPTPATRRSRRRSARSGRGILYDRAARAAAFDEVRGLDARGAARVHAHRGARGAARRARRDGGTIASSPTRLLEISAAGPLPAELLRREGAATSASGSSRSRARAADAALSRRRRARGVPPRAGRAAPAAARRLTL